MDIEEPEVLFAQKLADCDPAIRKKAFSKLRQWVTSRMKSNNGFERSELITLWKGLYYCMWMQDKPLLHEELADRLCSLGDHFYTTDQHILYLDTCLETIGREWQQLDRWRVDKFLMLCRRFFRHSLNWLKAQNWNNDIWQRLKEMYSKTVWATDADAYPEDLKCHFAAIYLDELDAVGVFGLEKDHVFQFLDDYVKLLTAKISSLFFRSIENEIFDAILVDFAENAFPKPKRRGQKHVILLDPVGSSEALEVDYGRIADALMESGKVKSLKSGRRSTIYNLAKKYRAAANGQNPFSETIDIQDDIGDEELDKAAVQLLKLEKPKRNKRRPEQRKDSEASDVLADDVDTSAAEGVNIDEESELPVKRHKVARKKKTPQKKSQRFLKSEKQKKRSTR